MMKQLILLTIIIISISQGVKAQDLGVNFNESVAIIDTALVAKSKARLVRGFVHIPRFFLNIDANGNVTGVNHNRINTFSEIDPFLAAGELISNGEKVKLILSLKLDFKFKDIGVPKLGSQEMAYLMEAIEAFLKSRNVGNKIDILVLGNEPMWETVNEQAIDYGLFLNYFANQAGNWKTSNNWNFEIFSGALNRAKELNKNPILTQVLNVTKSNANIVGIDLHPHCKFINQVEDDLSFIRNTHRINKKIILTEFSLNRMFVDHSNDPIGEWGTQYGYSPETPMYLWLNILMRDAAYGTPHAPSEMLSFFESREWYPKNWFTTFYNAFTKYNVTAATYRLVDGIELPPNYLDSNSSMWLLNALYNGKLLGESDDGYGNTNPLCFHEWDKIMGVSTLLNQAEASGSIHCYPNPAIKTITVESNTFKNASVVLYGLSGKPVYINHNSKFPLLINIDDLKVVSGIYLLRLTSGNYSHTQKIIINRG